ncbi:MAG TPA: LysM peptidoglycan-binding domain-containing protein [Aliiroseovarius sp.]|nr:LysM peptidoglycan-binding domain-containing protein [Aliiroseovarius sp.]
MSESALAAITTMRDGVRYYTVAPGDSLAALAVKFYGRAGAYPMLFEANKDILSAPDMIRIGQKLRIPGQG